MVQKIVKEVEFSGKHFKQGKKHTMEDTIDIGKQLRLPEVLYEGYLTVVSFHNANYCNS